MKHSELISTLMPFCVHSGSKLDLDQLRILQEQVVDFCLGTFLLYFCCCEFGGIFCGNIP